MLTRNLDFDPNPTPPSVIVDGGESELWLGDRVVRLTEFDGHTGGTDLIAYIPDADVLIAGDLLFTKRHPYTADGNLRAWQSTLSQLAADYPTATILPGHGPVSDRADLVTLKGYLDYLEGLALAWKTVGTSESDAVAYTTMHPDYTDYLFAGLFQGNLAVAYQQITLGQDDATSIQRYFQAQVPELKAL